MFGVNGEYYLNVYRGEPVDIAGFCALRDRAVEIIGEMTMYRVNERTFQTLSEAAQECVRRAVCAQIEYLDANGGAEMDNGSMVQSAGLGKFSYTKATGADTASSPQIYSPRAARLLAPTGLLYRGRCL